MSDYIEESGMCFIAENIFHIEKSTLYTNLKNNGIKSVEFIRINNHNLMLVEAKTTLANPNNQNANNQERFNYEIKEICEKFVHSINMFSAIRVGVTKEALLHIFSTDTHLSLELVLVIKNHELKWCRIIQQKLRNDLPDYFKKIWKPEIFVINHAAAIQRNLVLAD
jgi:hypothetical protein